MIPATFDLAILSAPNVGPTVFSSTIFAGTGKAPAFNKFTIRSASSYAKPLSPPEI